MAEAGPEAAIRAALDRLAAGCDALGIALSGGGDSTALLHIAAGWAGARGVRLAAATVDHGLRAGSDAEAQAAGRTAAGLGIPHHLLRWDRAAGEAGNLMAGARTARLRLLSGWARDCGLGAVALGHTRDDLAETLLMRLERGAGLDGLAAMAAARRSDDMLWLRPMLDAGRAELRDWLAARGIGWAEDPTNDNPDYDRARIRQAIAAAGLDSAALALSATNLAEARAALADHACAAMADASADRGTLSLPRAAFDACPAETRRRILIAATRWVTGAPYPPRRATTSHALEALAAGQRVTLDGALMAPGKGTIRIGREPAAAARSGAAPGPLWDDRWRLDGLDAGQQIAAPGPDGLAGLDWRAAGLSRDEAAASPAIFAQGRLIAAPLLQQNSAIRAIPLREIADFRAILRGE